MSDFRKIYPPIENPTVNFQLNKLYIIDAIDVYNFIYKDYEHYKQLNWRRKFILDEELFDYIYRRAQIDVMSGKHPHERRLEDNQPMSATEFVKRYLDKE